MRPSCGSIKSILSTELVNAHLPNFIKYLSCDPRYFFKFNRTDGDQYIRCMGAIKSQIPTSLNFERSSYLMEDKNG